MKECSLRIGVIGVGGWGKNHLRVLSEQGMLCSFCDIESEKVRLYERLYGVKGYTSLDEFLDNSRPDAVVVCTPTSTHFEVAKKVIEHDIPVMVEKPMTYTRKEGIELVRIAENKGVTLAVGYIERFNPAVRKLKEMLQRGQLGQLLLLELHRTNKRPFMAQDVGVILDTSVHDIDTARWILDSEPEVIFARTGLVDGSKEDFAAIMLGFTFGRTALIASSWATSQRVRRIIATTTRCAVTVELINQTIRLESPEGSRDVEFKREEPLKRELNAFANRVKGGQGEIVSGRDALGTTIVAEAAIRSARTGMPVRPSQLEGNEVVTGYI